MIIWVNGAAGAGKSRAAREMLDLIPDSTLYEPESLGDCLRRLLPEKLLEEVTDHQELPIWRRLVVDTAAALLDEVGGTLVVPMTLLRQEHRDEIFGGLASRGIEVRHVLLDPGETILRERLAARRAHRGGAGSAADADTAPDTAAEVTEVTEAAETTAAATVAATAAAGAAACVTPPGPRPGPGDSVAAYAAALPWLTLDAHVLPTAGLSPRQTALAAAEAVGRGAGVCRIVQTPQPRAETVAAGVLLFDDDDRVLLVDPTYKPGWEFPGGVVEPGESPVRAGHREVAEELGIELTRGLELLVVDWEPPRPPGHGGLRLIFDGGRVPTADIDRLLLPDAELRDWRFVTEDEAARLLPPVRLDRLRWALRAREQGRPLNLEAGQPAQ